MTEVPEEPTLATTPSENTTPTTPSSDAAPAHDATQTNEVPPERKTTPASEPTPIHDPAAVATIPPTAASESFGPPTTTDTDTPQTKSESKKPGITLGLVAGFAAVALLGGASGAGVALWAVGNQNTASVSGTSGPASITVNDPGNATLVTAVVAKAAPAIVTINVSGQNTGGSGSGVVISADGNVITNAHVVTLDGKVADPKVTVTTSDGRLLSATVIGFDPISDIAVINIDDATDMPFVKIADSSKLNVGDNTVAIGAPLGLSGTVTSGIVSALNRSITIASSALPADPEVTTPKPDNTEAPDLWNFDLFGENGQGNGQGSPNQASVALSVIQTDAAINPGNSGGALLNSDGELIGINVAIASSGGTAGSIGVGFAIPSNFANRVANEILENGKATHGLLGASVADVTDDPAQSKAEVIGASIVDVSAGGAAADAGLKVGDIVTGFDGLPITNKTDLTAQVRAYSAGEKATISYVRGGEAYTANVTLGSLG